MLGQVHWYVFGSSANTNQVVSAHWCLLAGISEQWFTTYKVYGLHVPMKDNQIKQVLTM